MPGCQPAVLAAVFGIMVGTASPTARSYLHGPTGAPPGRLRGVSRDGRGGRVGGIGGAEPGHRVARDPSGRPGNHAVAAGILPAVEPGILPGGMAILRYSGAGPGGR